MNFLVNQLDRVRRRWYVVVAVVVVFVIGAGVSTLGQSTTYSAKAALSTSSPGGENSPYALSLAYIYLFNDPAFQGALLREAKVPAGVSAVAEPATVGTIFYIATTASSADEAKTTATALADVFRGEINGALAQARQQTIDAVQRPFLDQFAQRLEVPGEERIGLQEQINTINATTNGTVSPVGLESAVTENAPATTSLLGIAVAGGLLFGLIAALAWEIASRRIRTGYDITDKAGIAEVAVIAPAGASAGADRRADLRHLANRLTSGPLDGRQVIAVVPAQAGAQGAVHEIARALVTAVGTVDSPAVLVRAAASSASDGSAVAGFLEALTDPGIALDDITVHEADGIGVIGYGEPVPDTTGVVTRSRVSAFLDSVTKSADAVVIEVSVPTESPEAQVICAQASQTVLVVDTAVATVSEVRDGRRLLDEVHAHLALAVAIESVTPTPEPAEDAAPDTVASVAVEPDSVEADVVESDSAEADVVEPETGDADAEAVDAESTEVEADAVEADAVEPSAAGVPVSQS